MPLLGVFVDYLRAAPKAWWSKAFIRGIRGLSEVCPDIRVVYGLY